jgi:hypothetical protein
MVSYYRWLFFSSYGTDALMSEDSPEVSRKAHCMFSEISRVLNKNGKYACITLAEKFILENLLSYFTDATRCWTIDMYPVVTKDDCSNNSTSPFIPFLVLLSKTDSKRVQNSGSVRVHFDTFGAPLADSEARYMSFKDTLAHALSTQQAHQQRYKLGRVEVGRFDTYQFFSSANDTIPRFTMFVADVDVPPATKVMR